MEINLEVSHFKTEFVRGERFDSSPSLIFCHHENLCFTRVDINSSQNNYCSADKTKKMRSVARNHRFHYLWLAVLGKITPVQFYMTYIRSHALTVVAFVVGHTTTTRTRCSGTGVSSVEFMILFLWCCVCVPHRVRPHLTQAPCKCRSLSGLGGNT